MLLIKFILGGSINYESAELNDCKCEGGLLKSVSVWDAVPDPLTGCCGPDGVNHQQATSYKLQIFNSECCSECFLVQASISYKKPIKN